MEHPLEAKYGLTAYELLDAVNKRFRLKVALEGAVAEVQMAKKIDSLVGNVIERYEAHDLDGHPDFSIWISGRKKPLRARARAYIVCVAARCEGRVLAQLKLT